MHTNTATLQLGLPNGAAGMKTIAPMKGVANAVSRADNDKLIKKRIAELEARLEDEELALHRTSLPF